MVSKFLLEPGIIENWVVMIDTAKKSVFNFPMKIITRIIKVCQLVFPERLYKMFITNPSTSLVLSWNVISSSLDNNTNSKIEMVDKQNFANLQEHISKDQLEKKYGGDIEVTDYWPPMNTIDPNRTDFIRLQKETTPRTTGALSPTFAKAGSSWLNLQGATNTPPPGLIPIPTSLAPGERTTANFDNTRRTAASVTVRPSRTAPQKETRIPKYAVPNVDADSGKDYILPPDQDGDRASSDEDVGDENVGSYEEGAEGGVPGEGGMGVSPDGSVLNTSPKKKRQHHPKIPSVEFCGLKFGGKKKLPRDKELEGCNLI
eukprot:TRINITY_DN10819_c0_g1_i3.p1 TRINITY_DN10819_c0_g1~~TRINITY_DN10819_c0_g1_i3.p1  ORF type:complete len:316 (+),score=87.56 TRINITY_DN10819_c0_g1_i3:559-1506(+)